jgi:hypothetical protein
MRPKARAAAAVEARSRKYRSDRMFASSRMGCRKAGLRSMVGASELMGDKISGESALFA